MEETQPLLAPVDDRPRHPTFAQSLVEFDPTGDQDNPLDWPQAYKQGVVALLAFMAFTVTFTCIGVVPIADQIVFDLEGKENKLASILLVTVWELGEAAGPLLIGPLSEVYGRYPVFIAANALFIIGATLSALSQTSSLLIFTRFLTGFAVASNVLNPAIIGDVFPPESRGSGMSLVMLAPLLGGAVGPAISGTIAQMLGWRKILWMCAFVAVICETLFVILFRETYKVTILARRAARLRKEMEDGEFKCDLDGDGAGTKSSLSVLRTTITRPAMVVTDSFVLKIVSIYASWVFTFYYVVATTWPEILREVYHFSPAMIGYSFLCFSIGATGGIIVCKLFLDSVYINMGKARGGAQPEDRLPFFIGGSILFPVIVALYGWAPYAQWPVHVLLVTVALQGFDMIMITVPLSSYIVDAFGLYSASAMTVVLIARCLSGTLLPLAIPPLVEAFGLGYGFLGLSAVCLVLIPVPMAIMRYGAQWRQKSIYTRDDESHT